MLKGLAVLAVGFVVGVGAPAAQAAIVYDGGNDLWVMNDDGSGAQVLVTAASVGASDLHGPQVSPSGDALVFGGSTRSQTGPGTHCGLNCQGLYSVVGGVVRRISPDPAPCTTPCSSFESDADVSSDGQVVYETFICAGHPTLNCQSKVNVRPVTGGASEEWGTRCDRNDLGPAFNPANPAEIAFTDCWDDDDRTSLWVSGRARAGERRVACDDGLVNDATWSRDGASIATAESQGADNGIWMYGAGSDACAGAPSAQHVVSIPEGEFVQDPEFMGDGRILFTKDTKIHVADPGTCSPCAFPAGAPVLGDGTSPAWTPSLGFLTQPGTGPGGGDPGGGGPGTGPGFGPGPGSNPIQSLSARRTQRARRGFQFTINLAGAGVVSVRIDTAGRSSRAARRLGTVRLRARAGRNRLTVRKVGRKRLRPGRYVARISATVDGVRSPARRVSFRLKR